jgi:hypothetical protein
VAFAKRALSFVSARQSAEDNAAPVALNERWTTQQRSSDIGEAQSASIHSTKKMHERGSNVELASDDIP